MKHVKKVVSALLITSVFMANMAIPAMATEIPENTFVCSTDNFNEIVPYLDYISTLFCNLSYENGAFIPVGTYSSFQTNKINFTVYLERSSNNSSWTTIDSWSKTFNPGNGANIVSGKYGTSAAGYYRAKATTLVYSSSGSIVENVTVYSRTIRI
ncbi:hypothetical protein [Massilioclostridium coli]|uniref:hypothetical protein n=1 Tax=Massilioclostridium coli TaxID=1870991 RepID=UPI0022E799F7|nr:hypothetical protein [Massilioclostridium coli]